MARRRAHVAAISAVLLAGCGSSEAPPVPVACIGEPETILRALERAPARVALADGTPLSRCVDLGAARDGDLQALGLALTQVADALRRRAETDPAAALRLGYLVGAVRRGAALTPGIAAQLARRVEQATAPQLDELAARRELERGIRLGEADG